MIILHIDFEKTWRGGQQQLLWLLEELEKKGHKNFVLCQPRSALLAKLQKNFFSIKMFFEFDPFTIYRTAKIIDKIKPDIVHLHSAHAHTIGLLASKILKHKPKLVSSRRVDFHIKSLWKYKNVDRIIAISEGVKKVLVEDGIPDAEISVVYSGVDLSRFENISSDYLFKELEIDKNNNIVGIIASLAPHKDHKNFLQAAAIIKEKLPNTKFLVVGEGKLKNALIRIAEKLKIFDSVIFTGFRNDVPQLLSIFNVFVLSSYLEGLCTSVIDAMASCVPVVATNVGGVGELVADGVNGFLVPPRNPELLAEKTIKILTEKNLQQKFSQNSKIKSKNFSKEKMVEKTEKIYFGLL
ncbi:MAG: glycosyltransferase [Elusimicrobiota bacterium]